MEDQAVTRSSYAEIAATLPSSQAGTHGLVDENKIKKGHSQKKKKPKNNNKARAYFKETRVDQDYGARRREGNVKRFCVTNKNYPGHVMVIGLDVPGVSPYKRDIGLNGYLGFDSQAA